MSVLEQAIEKEQWELAALCLCLGALKAAAKLPPGSVVGLLEALETPGLPERGRRHACEQ